ncbi:ATP-binding protein [Duganella guangzhouensis]|uniref:ATP-binding protein n=1 Tax=Duganella guangzhouensis TaxID=2666084 RepID=UPI003530ACB4
MGGGPASTSLGLGLFIAREITLAHGGAITVASDTRSGTVFTVWLPEAISAPAPLAGCPV